MNAYYILIYSLTMTLPRRRKPPNHWVAPTCPETLACSVIRRLRELWSRKRRTAESLIQVAVKKCLDMVVSGCGDFFKWGGPKKLSPWVEHG